MFLFFSPSASIIVSCFLSERHPLVRPFFPPVLSCGRSPFFSPANSFVASFFVSAVSCFFFSLLPLPSSSIFLVQDGDHLDTFRTPRAPPRRIISTSLPSLRGPFPDPQLLILLFFGTFSDFLSLFFSFFVFFLPFQDPPENPLFHIPCTTVVLSINNLTSTPP